MLSDFGKFFFDWNPDKNDWLKKNRDLSFEDVLLSIKEGNLLDVIDNPSKNFPNQKVLIVLIRGYVCYVPFVIDKENKVLFLKTIIPSRKLNKAYNNKKIK